MDEPRMRALVGKLVSVLFDHGVHALGTLTVAETDPPSVPLFGLSTVGSGGPWNNGHRFRASAVTTISEVR
jgi:hypothetical protein